MKMSSRFSVTAFSTLMSDASGQALRTNSGTDSGEHSRVAVMVLLVSAVRRHPSHCDSFSIFNPLARNVLSQDDLDAIQAEFEKQGDDRSFEEWHKLVIDMGSILVHVR